MTDPNEFCPIWPEGIVRASRSSVSARLISSKISCVWSRSRCCHPYCSLCGNLRAASPQRACRWLRYELFPVSDSPDQTHITQRCTGGALSSVDSSCCQRSGVSPRPSFDIYMYMYDQMDELRGEPWTWNDHGIWRCSICDVGAEEPNSQHSQPACGCHFR